MLANPEISLIDFKFSTKMDQNQNMVFAHILANLANHDVLDNFLKH